LDDAVFVRQLDKNALTDGFGRPLEFRHVLYQAGEYAPEEGFLVLSAGPDGEFETADDIGHGAPYQQAIDHGWYDFVLKGRAYEQIRGTIRFTVDTREPGGRRLSDP
jgi:hypothetical protein